jgi:hypothetical protein
MTDSATQPQVTGEALLQMSESMKEQSFAAFCRAAGYVKINKKDGKLRPDQDGLKSALLKAHGHAFVSAGPRTRVASNIVKVGKTGVVQVGKAYLSTAGAVPGDAFRITVTDVGGLVLDPITDEEAIAVPPALPTTVETERVPALAA